MKYEFNEYGNTRSNDLVLIIHGTGSSRSFGSISRHLNQQLRYISISLPGHDGVSFESIDDLNDLVGYVKSFILTLKYTKISIIGFSLGGLIALKLYDEYRNSLRIHRIVCWATPFLSRNVMIRFIYMIITLLSVFVSTLPDWFMKFLEFFDMKFTKNEFDVLRQSGLKNLRKTIGIVMGAELRPIDSDCIVYIFDKWDNLATKANLKLFTKFISSKTLSIDRSGHFGTKEGWGLALKEIDSYLNN